jgi:hypothetical protein
MTPAEVAIAIRKNRNKLANKQNARWFLNDPAHRSLRNRVRIPRKSPGKSQEIQLASSKRNKIMKPLEMKNNGLIAGNRLLLVCLMCLISMPLALAQKHHPQQAVSIAGVYGGDFKVGAESGDLEGMRVVIVAAGGGYHAIVQVAQGGAEDPKPEFVEVTVKGMTVTFAGMTGTVTAAGLRVKNEDGTTELLKRKPCASYFGMKP